MKIFKTKQDVKPSNSDYIFNLIDNDLSLQDKIDNLIENYQRLKLDPDGFSVLIELLFLKSGMKPYFPRKGDVNERFDLLIENNNLYKIVSEIEIPSVGILDAPRNMLDNIAVLVNRRNEKVEKLVPLVICWDLPNNRTDYWNVITDIKKVLNIEIKTCSIVTLAILVWTNKVFDPKSSEYFLDSSGNISNNNIKQLSDLGIDKQKYLRFLKPLK